MIIIVVIMKILNFCNFFFFKKKHSATGFWHRHVRHIEGGIGPRDKLGDKYWDNRGVASQSVAEDSDDDERRGSSIDGSVILRSHNTRSLGSFGSGAFTVSQLDPRALAERHAGVIKLFADTNDVAVAQVPAVFIVIFIVVLRVC